MSRSTYTAHAIAHYSDAIGHIERLLEIIEYAQETRDVSTLDVHMGLLDEARDLVRDVRTIVSDKPLTARDAITDIRTDLRDILRRL